MLKITPICIEHPDVLKLQRPYAILLVSSGEGILKVNDEQAELLPNRVFLLKDGLQVLLEGNMLVGHLIEFQEVMLRAFLLQSAMHRNKGLYNPNVSLPHVDLKLEALVFVFNLISQLILEMEEGTSPLGLMHYLFALLRHVNKDVEHVFVLDPNNEEVLLKLIILIEAHYKNNRKTSFYATALKMEDRKLNDFCKEYFEGSRLAEVLMARILTEVDYLLLQNKLSIQQISNELNFSNPGHLNKVYKTAKKISPKEYRRRNVK